MLDRQGEIRRLERELIKAQLSKDYERCHELAEEADRLRDLDKENTE